MNVRSTLLTAAAAGLFLLTAGLTEATATDYHPRSSTAAASTANTAPTTAAAPTADDDADDDDTSTPTNPTLATAGASGFAAALVPNYDECRFEGTNVGSTCYQWVGDDQWVMDGWTNGWAAVAHVQTNYGKDRYCQARPSAEGWDYCKFDHQEGKCVRMRMYELKDGVTRNWGGWSAWYGTSYGWPC